MTPPTNPVEIDIDAMLRELRAQRNRALDQVSELAGINVVLERKITNLTAQLATMTDTAASLGADIAALKAPASPATT